MRRMSVGLSSIACLARSAEVRDVWSQETIKTYFQNGEQVERPRAKNNVDAMRSTSFLSIFASSTLVACRVNPIIVDTDIFSDVDDVGALAVANVLHNCGLCDLKGVMINTNSKHGALATSVRLACVLASLIPRAHDLHLGHQHVLWERRCADRSYSSHRERDVCRLLSVQNLTLPPSKSLRVRQQDISPLATLPQ